MPKVYLAGPVSGLTLDQATHWRKLVTMCLKPIECISPLRGADSQPGKYFNPNGDRWTSMKSIFTRDHYDVKTCDVMLVNFVGAKKVSRGTLMEIAWAYAYCKPIVCVIDDQETNPCWDVFMAEAISFIEKDMEAAIDTIRFLLNKYDKYSS